MRKRIYIFSKFVKIAKDVSGTFIETDSKQDWRQISERRDCQRPQHQLRRIAPKNLDEI